MKTAWFNVGCLNVKKKEEEYAWGVTASRRWKLQEKFNIECR